MKLAFIDETFREPRPEATGYYQLSAVLVDGTEEAALRATVLGAVNHGETMHTSSYVAAGRSAQVHGFLDVIAGSTAWNLVVVTSGHTRDQESARQRVLTELLVVLEANKIRRVVTDSREQIVGRDPQARNKIDLATAARLRRRGLIDRHLSLTHAHDSDEPLLWVPDAVGWAFRQQELRNNSAYWEHVEAVATVHRL